MGFNSGFKGLKIIVHCKIIFKLIGADNGAESVGLKWNDKIKY